VIHAAPGRGKKTVDNVNRLTTAGGNSPTYALRRLKRDRPDLAALVVSGELSANATAIGILRSGAAGWHQSTSQASRTRFSGCGPRF
jgi:hypothetical protein